MSPTAPLPPGYSGYRSFEYLDPGTDFEQYEVTPQGSRVAPYDLGLSDAQAARVEHLLSTLPVISLHDHLTTYPLDPADIEAYCRSGRIELAYEGIARSGLTAALENIGGPISFATSRNGWKWTDLVHDLGIRIADIDHQDYVVLARSVKAIAHARAHGQFALVLGLEGADPIENELDRIDVLYGFGVRQMGLVYNSANLLGGGLKEAHDGGLTRFGHRVVERMNKIGMAIDLAHAGDRTTLEAIAASRTPVLLSHTGARGVWPSERMKPDVVLTALAERGGLVGIEAAPNSALAPDVPGFSLESVMRHFEYCVELMGIEHVTFGPDNMYGDHSAFHTAMSSVFGGSAAPFPSPDDDPLSRIDVENPTPHAAAYCAGLENASESMRNVTGWLVAHDYSDDEIAAVIGGNSLRVLDEIWW